MYMYTYPWYHWITFFFIYSFFGWIFESTYVSILKRRFVNRGFLRLPLLPLYGTGAVMMLWLSLPVQDSVVLVYLAGVVGATVLEYVTGYVMERLFKIKYWDYSNQRFNYRGYICLSSSVAWGFLTIFLTEVIHRPIAEFVLGMNLWVETALLIIVGAAFIADTIVSVKAALDLGRALEAMTKMKAELDDLQVQASLLRAEISERLEGLSAVKATEAAVAKVADAGAGAVARVADARAGAAAKVAGIREEAAAMAGDARAGAAAVAAGLRKEAAAVAADVRSGAAARVVGARDEAAAFIREHVQSEEALTARIRALSEKREALAGHMSFYRRNILRGNPSASSSRFGAALKEMRENADKKKGM